ncbi:MAG: single-stranded DNA-binding protein [Acidimicrobiia bacterium]
MKGSVMDLNLVVLAGTLAVEPEIREFSSGARLIRYLVTVRSSDPVRRVDVIPAVLWGPHDVLVDAPGRVHQRIWVAGRLQRRFWSTDGDGRSRVELFAQSVQLDDGAGVLELVAD